MGVGITVIGETLTSGVNQTYSAADATSFGGIIIASGAESLFDPASTSTFFPAGRPGQILVDGYRWGKPVGALGSASGVLSTAGIKTTAGVYAANQTAIVALRRG